LWTPCKHWCLGHAVVRRGARIEPRLPKGSPNGHDALAVQRITTFPAASSLCHSPESFAAAPHHPLYLVDVECADRLVPNEWRRSWNRRIGSPVRLAALTNRR